MKIVWVSPHGSGWSLAYRLRELGNKVVLYNPTNKNGQGYLPQVTPAAWLDFAAKADLVVCDDVPESRRTRRSWSASDLSVDLQQLRHSGVHVLGPTPTTELLHNDLRYRKKILVRNGLGNLLEEVEGIDVTLSLDPNGQRWLIFRHRHLMGNHVGPDLGNLGDVVLPCAGNPLGEATLDKLKPFFDGLGYNGYTNLDLTVAENKLQIRDITTGFLYPACFIQFANLLVSGGSNQPVVPGLAVTILNLKGDKADVSVEDLLEYPGVFGADLHRKPDERGAWGHGEFLGAVVGSSQHGAETQADVYRKLHKIVGANPGLGFRSDIGAGVGSQLQDLHKWGWV